jgi:hypothetical protein
MHLYGAADNFEAVGRQHLQVLQFFQVRVTNLALGAMAFADQTGVASLLHLRRVGTDKANAETIKWCHKHARSRLST